MERLFLVFLILTMQIMLVSGTDQDALIRNLVEERIEIMDAFFNGSMTEKDAAAALCRVESGRPAAGGSAGISRLFSDRS